MVLYSEVASICVSTGCATRVGGDEALSTRGDALALLICPDCEHTVSDQAFACPNCGRPVRAGEFRAPTGSPSGWAKDPPRQTATAATGGKRGSSATAAREEPARHPWIRYWARSVDSLLAALGFAIVIGFLSPGAFAEDDGDVALFFSALFVWIFVEAIMLSVWGTTPGKALMRIAVTRDGVRPLAFGDALARSFRVWFFGLGMGIPIVSVFTLIAAYKKLISRGKASWDTKLDLQVNHGKVSGLRWTALVVIILIVSILGVATASGL